MSRPVPVQPPLPDRAAYRARWSTLHGGYDPGRSRVVGGYLTAVERAARPLAARGIGPDEITAAGVGLAALSVPAAARGRWRLAASIVAVSALADGLDGAVAALTGRAGAWGYVLDSLADRASDGLYLLALRRAGAAPGPTAAAAAGVVALEYARARAGAAGLEEVGVVTVGERPTRVAVTSAAFLVAAVFPERARTAATVGAAAVAGLSSAGAGQFLRVAARLLRGRSVAADSVMQDR